MFDDLFAKLSNSDLDNLYPRINVCNYKRRENKKQPTLSTTDSMQLDRASCLLTLSLTKYEGRDEGKPTDDRIVSMSYIVNKKMT